MKTNPINRLFLIPVFALLLVGFFTGCKTGNSNNQSASSTARQAAYNKITAQEAYTMMSELTDYTILDVRTEREYAEKRIKGAILIPDSQLRSRVEKEIPNKDQVIFTYCFSGRRSYDAAMTLVNLGYTNVYDMGSINDWTYETETGEP
jgi:rhodanese-related sulfurtransferase